MLYIGLGFLVDWVLVEVLNVELVKSLLITAIIFIIFGLLVGEFPNVPTPWRKP